MTGILLLCQISFYLTFTFLYSFAVVVKPRSLVRIDATYFMQTQTVALTFLGIFAGVNMNRSEVHSSLSADDAYLYVPCFSCRISPQTWIFSGIAIMTHSRGANISGAELVWTVERDHTRFGWLALNRDKGAFLVVPAVTGANTMPGNLEGSPPWLTDEEQGESHGSITSVPSSPRGHPVREGVIQLEDGDEDVGDLGGRHLA
ncbi:hypothetical protein BDN67DRAFT_983286 [Paxillus ammoniavirescens]|nr:hypothetical protein BDN67DRAFT_983286 [Paxillus ammoniavirescens]